MGLERLIDNNGKLVEYDTDKFYNSFRSVQEIGQVRLNSTEGLNKFKEITGYDLSKMTPEQAEYEKNAIVQGYSQDAQKYALSHFNGLFGELDEQTKYGFTLQFVPSKTYKLDGEKDEESEEYENTRKEARKWNEELGLLENEPGKALENRVKEINKNAPKEVANYVIRAISTNQGEYLKIMKQNAQGRGIYALSKYNGGAERFLKDTRKRVGKEVEEKRKELEKIEEEKNKKLNELRQKIDYNTAPIGERLRLEEETVKDYISRAEELVKNNPDIGLIDQMNSSVIELAYKSIEQKKAEEAYKKAQKEALEKAKKGQNVTPDNVVSTAA